MKTALKPKPLSIVLRELRKAGIRYERIAYELDVAFGTVKAWEVGTRKPKAVTIRALEQLYRVRIL